MKGIGKMRVGLIVPPVHHATLAQLGPSLAEAPADVFLFPESYLRSDNLPEAREFARENGKWLVVGIDDLRERGTKFLSAVVIDPRGEVAGEHRKTVLTDDEQEDGFAPGDSIRPIETDIGKFGISICYELHFPEVTRIYALQGATIIFNPIRTGMWDEKQYLKWTTVASARASENEVFVLGCSHFNDAIPIAFAYAPTGECIVQSREVNRVLCVTIDPAAYPPRGKLSKRRPELYGRLVE